jgi:HSP20 family protein
MTNLIQWDPFTELRTTMDRLFDQGFSRPWRLLPATDYQASFPVDVWETDEAVEIEAALPGIRSDEVDISVAGEVVTIKADHRAGADEARRNYHRRELDFGSYSRSFGLPTPVDSEKAEASYENGMLHLRLPKAESVRPRQIKVTAASNSSEAAQLTA